MYENYIFDLYGTLVDIHTNEERKIFWEKMSLLFRFEGADYQAEELHDAYREAVEDELSNLIVDNQRRYVHEGNPEIRIEEVFKKLYRDKKVEAGDELIYKTCRLFRGLSTEFIDIYEGADLLLKELKKRGKRVYLLSNAQRVFTEYELSRLGILEYFDGILISSDEGMKKPDIRFFNLLQSRFGVDFHKSIMIGNDAKCDIEPAIQCGMDTLYIRSDISPQNDETPNSTFALEQMDMKSVKDILVIGK